jgi:hypothetical protein
MSIFRVNLNNTAQGRLDVAAGTQAVNPGAQNATSIQRSVYIMGPGKVNRKLMDGVTFQDCNYYKRFCYPQVSLEDAILTLVTDDGSVYSDVPAENTAPYAYSRTIAGWSTYSDTNNIFDILTNAGGPATFVQLTNNGLSTLSVRLNGLTTAVFSLDGGTTQVFNAGDLQVSLIEVANTGSGHTACDLEIVLAVRSQCNS